MNLSKWQENVLIVGLLILLFPFFALSFYIQPEGDDFLFAMKMTTTGALSFVKEMYFDWSGRYFSMFLGALDPWRMESKILLQLSLFVFHLLFISSFYLFFRIISNRNSKSKSVIIFTLVFYVIFIHNIPDINSLLYWYPSVSAYQVGMSLYIIFLSFSILNYLERLSNVKYLVINTIISILIIGSNELFILPLGFTILLLLIIRYKTKKYYYIELSILITIVLFSLIMILAPGNYKRMTWYSENISLLDAYALSLKSLFYIAAYYLQNPSFVLASIILFISSPNLIKNVSVLKIDISKSLLILSLAMSFALLSFLLFPATYSLKCVPTFRVMDVLAFYFFLFWTFNLFLFSIYVAKNHVSYFSFPLIINKILILFLLTSMVSSVFIIDNYKFKDRKRDAIFFQGNIAEAYYTLIFEAETYEKEMGERYSIFQRAKNQNISTVKFKALTFQPAMLLGTACKNIALDSNNLVPEGIYFGERKYYHLDTLICEKL